MQNSVKSTVRKFIADNFMYRDGAQSLADTDSFLDAGLIDSTGVLELVGFLEKTFGIRVADADIVPENLDSVERIAGYIDRKTQAAAV